ncbi:hypothetical protein N7466_002979 [Penicillium verhagenii]|uniref:uncharacterized protein n=1 Tax=Penicillium verhagenii TaxID=1562060 RepID=UPI00254578F7|nr:uncharacterized protein N7466_002979 [Penicillium verhagenii]KAJ5936529.1 hypothetical protein N7466_002979 [Penicillium verhagenii]
MSIMWASQSGTAVEAGNIVHPPHAEEATESASCCPVTREGSDGRPSSSQSPLRHDRPRPGNATRRLARYIPLFQKSSRATRMFAKCFEKALSFSPSTICDDLFTRQWIR